MRFPDQSMEAFPLLPNSPAGLVSTPAVYVGAYKFTFYVQMALAGIVTFFMGLMGVAQMSMMSLEGKPEAQTASARAWAERNAHPAVEDVSLREDHPLGADALPVRNSWRGAHPSPAMGRSSSFFTPPSPPASPQQSRPPPPAPPMHPSLLSPTPARSTPPASPSQRAAELPLADLFAPGGRGDGGMAGQRGPVGHLQRANSDPPPHFGYSPSAGSPSRSMPYSGRRLG